ncbi:iron uptake transporter deferrochelatase/peroxidase subunit [Paenibacillus polymyxa]|uniref:iron uptake transporter deferrochelatase/peroxidase subunit n=1 Tax=Paenibacillus polymyxa TaxID=1406 RepID=UPI003B5AAE1F
MKGFKRQKGQEKPQYAESRNEQSDLTEKDAQPADDERSGKGKSVSRRDLLKLAGVGGLGLLLGGGGVGAVLSASQRLESMMTEADTKDVVPFYGKHQAGIVTPAQDFICFAAFDLTTPDKEQVRNLFKAWTEASATMTSGVLLGTDNENINLPPSDTGEAAGLSPSRTTITFGVGPSFFDGRYGLAGLKPAGFRELPRFQGDALDEQWCGGDIGVQVCANDLQVAFHALRNLARIARGTAVLRWTQEGFQRTAQADPAGSTPRNLLGFKDGTGNPDTSKADEMNRLVWTQTNDGPAWMGDGSYMAVRRIRMRVEVWDRSTLGDQEDTFGRHRSSGAPLGKSKEFDKLDLAATSPEGKPLTPPTSHVALAHGDGSINILRRSYSYSSGLDKQTGQLDAGLLFISYQRDLFKQFVHIQEKLARNDKLNEYIVHKGSAVFACFPGVSQGGYIGDTLF